jgi:transcription initiation factor TFIIIB Brf1 subunit/transcription initiation factor TFIIB
MDKEKMELSLANPQSAIHFASELKQFIDKNKLAINIVGKSYILVEGWQFAGMMFGIYPIITAVENLSDKEARVYKFRATVELRTVKDNQLVGSGVAFCSTAEQKKRTFEEYAVASMAQTRAIGKAYRNLLGFIIKAAGFEATPYEEMEEFERIANSIK